jgi:plasmid maintenance system antidote protein VapI
MKKTSNPPTVDPIERLRAYVDGYKTQRAAAASLGVSAPFLNMVLKGNREITDEMLRALGLERVAFVAERRRA